MEEVLSQVIETLEEKYPNYSVSNETIRINGDRYRHKKFGALYIDPILKEMNELEILTAPELEKQNIYSAVIEEMRIDLRDKKIAKYQTDAGIPQSKIDVDSLFPIVDVVTDSVLLYNHKIQGLSDINVKTWERVVSKDEKTAMYDGLRYALFSYDPYDLASFVPIEYEGMEILKVNTYMAPAWRKRPEPADGELCAPPQIMKILKHLFPDEDCLEYVLNWMYLALVERNETYLVLNGAKGIGKGVFCSLLLCLVGRENFTEAPSSLLSSHFNSALDKKRIIVLDEFRVGKSEHTKLKRFINKYQNIEKKGIDADNATEIFNSYVIANNDVSDMHIESDDRRFSVPELTDRLLTETMPQKEVDLLIHELEHDEDLAYQFGYWLYNYGQADDLNSFSVRKSRKYYDLIYHSLYEWQKFIVDKVLGRDSEEYNIKSLSKEFSKDEGKYAKFPRNMKKVEDFLLNYRHRGDHRIAYYSYEDGKKTIIPDDRYLPEEHNSGTEEIFGEESETDYL